ncbi:HpcH/HpaI aldolase family protein [Halomonas huangheensis]|uniref:Alpha-dehydro-beta-deoxy-D-glucarate aldolase n=1 Tax=Halomonas huangheensis TaxID=1178482 RepID=W1N5L4_9GAMM|nr:HpcH/HpaI aldolase/citrate lyase family protein [Halomonas huangheensis]ALM54298.1 2-dehydro-3-deoxyglucarate aldolase [Halomonas huangheensis]ERL50852.1 alpha-dehydro-beta-deoxy-D-glucarate aldolase [Halomonas huangheensis]
MELPVNPFKASLNGTTRYGCWAGFGTAYAAEILATTGFDWLLIDGEHAPNPVPSILAQLQAVAAYSSAPVVRAVNHDPALIKQLLDIGTQTLMIPMVDTAEQAEALVRATRFPPHGFRGVGGGLTRATRWDAVPDYIQTAHQELTLIAQVESRQAIDNVEAIAATDGIDAVFVGPADLSTGVGHVGNPGHEDVQAMIRHALKATKDAGKAAGILAPAEEDAKRYAEWGFDFIAVGIDISLLRQAAMQTIARYKADAPQANSSRTY